MGIKHSVTVVHGQKGLATEWNDDHVIDSNVECGQYQHVEHVLENLVAWPGGPVEGQIIYRSDIHTAHVYNGTYWHGLQGSATVVVAADGSGDFTDIQDAIDSLPAGGGVVYIREGIYTITVGLSITTSNVSVIGAGKGTQIRTGAAVGIIKAFNVSGILISQIYCVSNPPGNATDGIRFQQVTDSVISHCWVEDVGGAAIRVDTVSTDNKIDSCTLIDSGSEGIIITLASHRCTVTGCVVLDNTSDGIAVGGDFCTITGCVSRNNTGMGLRITATDCTVTGNTMSYNSQDGIFSQSDRNVISANTASFNVWSGIRLSGADNCAVTGNVCYGNDSGNTAGWDGITLLNADNNVISGNRCSENDRFEINVSDVASDKNLIIGNHLIGVAHVGAFNDAGTATVAVHNVLA